MILNVITQPSRFHFVHSNVQHILLRYQNNKVTLDMFEIITMISTLHNDHIHNDRNHHQNDHQKWDSLKLTVPGEDGPKPGGSWAQTGANTLF